MFGLIGRFLAAFGRFLSPFANGTGSQRVGTVLTVIAILATAIGMAISAVAPVTGPASPTPTPAVSPCGDVCPPDAAPEVSAPVSALEVVFAGLTAPFACTAAQKAVWTAGLPSVADCALQCGLSTGTYALTATVDGVTLDGPGITRGVLGCLTPCLLRLGSVAVQAATASAVRYGGSAGEAEGYVPDRITIVVTQRR